MAANHHLLLLYFLTDLMACLTPGPAVLAVTSHALGGSLRGAAGAIAGINLGNVLWFTLAGLGLATITTIAPIVFLVLRWVGISYLLYLGISMWRGTHAITFRRDTRRSGALQGLFSAIAIQLSNPKALLFFTVLLPPFLDPHAPMMRQIAVLALIGVITEVTVLAGYAAIAYRLGRLTIGADRAHWIGRASGGMLIGAAAAIALKGTR
ncbi:LysE family translocator [Sphingobium subterraneum]|uniref:Homoserine/homoserine lactone efflux protein n=1 Tax=Sphingobium subterraneum TaxID=627688 RepID=A0A841J3S2_9SPHN|nr:LysE family transporter [Sphingobium subterraneum]MBB6123168.1 homoserine/homoserine lactone efflux protein [Sphingobium subterraneum]